MFPRPAAIPYFTESCNIVANEVFFTWKECQFEIHI